MNRTTGYICLFIAVLAIQACGDPSVNNDETVKEETSEVKVEEVDLKEETVWYNLYELPEVPAEITEQTSGYFVKLNADGTINRLVPYCKGLKHGKGFMFHANGALDGYAEFDNNEMMRSIDLTDAGFLVNFFDGKERVINELKLQNISGEMKEKLDFVRSKCSRSDKIDQNVVLSHSCDD